jgi:hypothetical protein
MVTGEKNTNDDRGSRLRRAGLALGGTSLAIAVSACSGLYDQNTPLIEQRLPGLTAQAQTLQKKHSKQSKVNISGQSRVISYDLAAGGGATYSIDVTTSQSAEATPTDITGIDVQIQTAKDTHYGLELSKSSDGNWELREASKVGGQSYDAHAIPTDAAQGGLDSISAVLSGAANGTPATPALEQAIYNLSEPPRS